MVLRRCFCYVRGSNKLEALDFVVSTTYFDDSKTLKIYCNFIFVDKFNVLTEILVLGLKAQICWDKIARYRKNRKSCDLLVEII